MDYAEFYADLRSLGMSPLNACKAISYLGGLYALNRVADVVIHDELVKDQMPAFTLSIQPDILSLSRERLDM